MRNVICILANRMTTVLEENIKLLHQDFRILLHVDRKSNIDDFREILPFVELTNVRVEVTWSHSSLLYAMIELLKKAVEMEFSYISYMSELDLPMRSSDEINAFFQRNSGYEFMEISQEVSAYDRVFYRYPKFYHEKQTILGKLMRKTKIYKLFKKNGFHLYEDKVATGSQWVSLSYDFCNWCLDYIEMNPRIMELFEQGMYVDEVFFPTLINLSEGKFKVFNSGNNFSDSLRYIDWSSGKPAILLAENIDVYQEQSPNYLFFRKVSEKSDFEKYETILLGKIS